MKKFALVLLMITAFILAGLALSDVINRYQLIVALAIIKIIIIVIGVSTGAFNKEPAQISDITVDTHKDTYIYCGIGVIISLMLSFIYFLTQNQVFLGLSIAVFVGILAKIWMALHWQDNP
ncbi:Uncharacterised protein [Moraxella caprae]|uniref:Uncharacterized protein n=1 Tax=Moraxella caprae TaxID=90240 RepID=A0A378R3R7_9GAMM|nr:hypothetical protein [Moraxella caprae]STZ09648.1 Uncharacterised protein [Moraxella caprae]